MSWQRSEIIAYEWTLSDGTTASGPLHEMSYEKPGIYSEILKVTDSKGNIDYDFTVVNIWNREHPEKHPSNIQINYYLLFEQYLYLGFANLPQ